MLVMTSSWTRSVKDPVNFIWGGRCLSLASAPAFKCECCMSCPSPNGHLHFFCKKWICAGASATFSSGLQTPARNAWLESLVRNENVLYFILNQILLYLFQSLFLFVLLGKMIIQMCIVKKLMNYFPTKNFLKRINMSLAGRANDQLFLFIPLKTAKTSAPCALIFEIVYSWYR